MDDIVSIISAFLIGEVDLRIKSQEKFKLNITDCFKILKRDKLLVFDDVRRWHHFFFMLYTKLMEGQVNYSSSRDKQWFRRSVCKTLRTV